VLVLVHNDCHIFRKNNKSKLMSLSVFTFTSQPATTTASATITTATNAAAMVVVVVVVVVVAMAMIIATLLLGTLLTGVAYVYRVQQGAVRIPVLSDAFCCYSQYSEVSLAGLTQRQTV
jgi:hypothetical protein